ncbi:MAG: hypothetical protein R3183_12485, partial [Oleiphilaceae bacterium]|nr:hypothetical protein [Oleiphilaceae bacterium]
LSSLGHIRWETLLLIVLVSLLTPWFVAHDLLFEINLLISCSVLWQCTQVRPIDASLLLGFTVLWPEALAEWFAVDLLIMEQWLWIMIDMVLLLSLLVCFFVFAYRMVEMDE